MKSDIFINIDISVCMKRFIFMMIGIIVIVDIMAQSISKELATRC